MTKQQWAFVFLTHTKIWSVPHTFWSLADVVIVNHWKINSIWIWNNMRGNEWWQNFHFFGWKNPNNPTCELQKRSKQCLTLCSGLPGFQSLQSTLRFQYELKYFSLNYSNYAIALFSTVCKKNTRQSWSINEKQLRTLSWRFYQMFSSDLHWWNSVCACLCACVHVVVSMSLCFSLLL